MADFIDLLLSRFRFLNNAERLLLRDTAGSADVLIGMSVRDIEVITRRRHRISGNTLKKALNDAEKAQKILAADNINCLFFGERNYPAQLAEIYDPPYGIYYRGAVPKWDRPAAAVVGTRLASGRGIDAAFEMGFAFAEYGLPVVSGLAMGIDSAAHSGAVAGCGCTVAVLGGGADRIYPSVNRKLAASILENGGAVISEYLPGEDPKRHHFPERNRIISGLSRAVIVVEAPGRSGALITADFALEHGRDLYFHQAGIRSVKRDKSGKFERMIFDGAPVISSAGEVLLDWGVKTDGMRSYSDEMKIAINSCGAGKIMADRMRDELQGYNIKFNGNYFRRACYESSYSINS